MNPSLLSFAALDQRIPTQCRLLSLSQFECMVHIGVHDFEKKAAQRVWFDIDICVPLAAAPAAQDDISQTLNYDFLRELVLQTTGEVHHELQETLCDALLNQLLLHPSIVAVRVQTRKPDVYADCSSVGTERIGHKPW
jgi:dihydroneopterin aldolase